MLEPAQARREILDAKAIRFQPHGEFLPAERCGNRRLGPRPGGIRRNERGAAGIAEVKYHQDYHNDPLVRPILKDAGVKVIKL